MTIEVRVPQLPESVADATLVSWHKKPGDAVARDENLVDLETDKVVLEVPAPAAGMLKEIKLGDGNTVTSGQLLGVIEEGATAVPGASAPAIMAASSGATTSAQDASGVKAPASGASAAAKLSPAAKRVVEENKLDPNAVLGSGRDASATQGAASGGQDAAARRIPCKDSGGHAGRTRIAGRSTCADDPASGAHRRTPGAGPNHSSLADVLQRSRLEGRQ